MIPFLLHQTIHENYFKFLIITIIIIIIITAILRQECRDVISAMCPGPPTLGTMSAGEESSIAQV